MENSKKISIIVPAYNAEKYIRKCISSLIMQTYKLIEIIAVDDGSTDETGKILDEMSLEDERIIVIHQKNGGLPNARNAGLKKVSGEYVMFIDADDWLENDCCEVVINETINECADLIFFEYYKEFRNKTVPVNTFHDKKLIFEKDGKRKFDIYDMRTITAWGKLYKRDLVLNYIFDESLKTAEDVDFNYRIYDCVNKAVYINQKLLHYRILENSAVHGYDSKIKWKLSEPMDKLYEWMKDDESHIAPYYSFAAISYILICQNGICLNSDITLKQKVEAIKELGNDKRYKDLFDNIKSVRIPISRKLLIILGKMKLNFFIYLIVSLKLKLEKRG